MRAGPVRIWLTRKSRATRHSKASSPAPLASAAGDSVDEALEKLREAHQKYKYIELEISQRKQRLALKRPEIEKCLESVKLLRAQREAGREAVLDFALSDQVFARARLAAGVEHVALWLGAGVMLEYPLDEAHELLRTQLAGCERQSLVVQQEADFIRDQLTTTEVSMARVYNHGVTQRKPGVAAS